MRLVRVACLTLVVIGMCAALFGSNAAQAQTTPTIGAGGTTGSAAGSATIPGKADFVMRLLRDNGGEWVLMSEFEQRLYFNNARCKCDTKVRLELFFSPAGNAKKTAFGNLGGRFKLLVGEAGCLAADTTTRSGAIGRGNCQVLPKGDFSIASFAKTSTRATFDFPASMLFGPAGKDCSSATTQSIRLLIDSTGDDIPDVAADASPTLSIIHDGKPPTAPLASKISVIGGNEALEVKWEQAEGIADFRGYVVFCSRAENLQVFKPSFYGEQYFTAATVCGKETTATQGLSTETKNESSTTTNVAFATTSPDGNGNTGGSDGTGNGGAGGTAGATANPASLAKGPYPAPPGFANLDTTFVCSELLRTQRSARITGLQNGIPYSVGVASVDLHGNASPITEVFVQSPIATRDFYNGYKEAGGEAQGGFCAFGRRANRGVTPLFVIAGLALFIRGLARRRRQR